MQRSRIWYVLLVITSASITQAIAAQGPLPLDPLTLEERTTADSVASRDGRVRELLAGTRFIRVNTDFIAVKEANRQTEDLPARRTAEVLFYDYSNDVGLRILVGIAERRVLDLVKVPGRSVPINRSEVEQAARLALADPRVVGLFGREAPRFHVASGAAMGEEIQSPRIEGLRVVGADDNDPCFRHRCVVLFFRVNNRYVNMNRVSVDLTAQRVLLTEGDR